MSSYYTTAAPNVSISETDLATFVNPNSGTVAAIVGNFAKGQCDIPTLVSNEDNLIQTFGKPNNINYKDWFCARNYLNYSSALYVMRVVEDTARNACDASANAKLIKNASEFETKILSDTTSTAVFYAKYPGEYGNSIKVMIADKNAVTHSKSTIGALVNQIIEDNDIIVAVYDGDTLVELGVYSSDSTAKDYNGNSLYIVNAINNNSNYIWLVSLANLLGKKTTVEATDDVEGYEYLALNYTLSGGCDSKTGTGTPVVSNPSDAAYITGWNVFKDNSTYDLALLLQGGTSSTVGAHLVSVAESRGDCIACVSPQFSEIDSIKTGNAEILSELHETFGASSYRFLDGNYKYQYDNYNDVYRWVPLNGDIGGIFAQTDENSAPWYSPGGSAIKDCVKLAFYPSKTVRDQLFKYRVNAVTSFSDTGHVLYSDQTGASVNTSFNFVNIRRLFLTIEKNIAQYARQIMFKQNDSATRTQFYQSVDPYLRDVQGGRGISDYKIVCDETVNTADVIMSGRFIAKIYVKPVYSIRYVQLTMVSTRSDVEWDEITETA